MINFLRLPKVSLYASSFAGGASGYPLMFENYNIEVPKMLESCYLAGIFNDQFRSLLIPMYGRTIHSIDGDISFQAYGNKKEHYIKCQLNLNHNLN